MCSSKDLSFMPTPDGIGVISESRWWYCAFGAWPVASAIRLVKLYIAAISATSHTS